MQRHHYSISPIWQYPAYIVLISLLFIVGIAEAKEVIGIYERVKINDVGLIFDSKIDTGAENSSLNIKDIHLARKDGEIWVKFEIADRTGRSVILEKPLHRFVKIKRKKANIQQRPAILLDVCLGKTIKKVEVNLVDRSNFNYQMLIGRSFLRGDFIVDVEKSYTSEPSC